ncbi:hypothetical protein [Cellvibrio mixtus]|uniref:hypothetical protein n=1 Tax=Cellvibrio mixtus TaxID=39650 RepID=UPI001FD27264|nr:hypothetical protein [Cellvibrio mixtus]
MIDSPSNTDPYRTQHKLRLSYMPWLYARLKPAQRLWAQQWQEEWQAYLCTMETITLGKNCFIAPEARLFAEPGRPIIIGDNSYVAADSVLHGPLTLGKAYLLIITSVWMVAVKASLSAIIRALPLIPRLMHSTMAWKLTA